jgi:hypothetical protein
MSDILKKEDWRDVNRRFRAIMRDAKLSNGFRYRAITCDNDIFEGRLTYSSPDTAELHTESGSRSFSRSNTKLILIESTDNL